jgi:autotransporter-associated beta strand protein
MNPQFNNNRPVVRLENPSNTFTTIPEIRRGTLAFTSDGALGNATNGIRSNCEIGVTGGGDITIQGLRFDADNITLNTNRQIELVNTAEFVNVQGFTGTIAGPVVGTGSLRKLGSGTLRLTGAGSLTGLTSISNGTLRVDSPIWTGSSLAAEAGTTLMGAGTITAPVTISSGATLSPGASIGTLTVSNTLTLAAGSTTVIEINATSVTSDTVVGIGTLNYGGTLTVSLSGTPLAGQSYPLFSATSYIGNFAATSLPALGPGLTWNWTPANGTLSVVQNIATNPTNLTAVVSGSNLDLSWPASHTGWRLEVQTNSLSVGIATNWSTWPGSAATNAVSIPVNPANPTVFYRLVYP